MIREHDVVVLLADDPAVGLQAGDVGAVVHVHGDGAAFEVEFVSMTGRTVAIATVQAGKLRPTESQDLMHVRELRAA